MKTTEIKKGTNFNITHVDGKIVTEKVADIKHIREKKTVNVYHHIRINDIVRHYIETTKYTLVICESGAVYDIKDI